MPLACVLTLPATGTESNGNSVITKAATQEKLAFGSPLVYPVFAVLDPATTFSLPAKQIANGAVDLCTYYRAVLDLPSGCQGAGPCSRRPFMTFS